MRRLMIEQPGLTVPAAQKNGLQRYDQFDDDRLPGNLTGTAQLKKAA
jgi:hypothetical protein